jgi:hypothetical protein
MTPSKTVGLKKPNPLNRFTIPRTTPLTMRTPTLTTAGNDKRLVRAYKL